MKKENAIQNLMKSQEKRLKTGRTNQIDPNGYVPLTVLASDPPVTQAGQFGLYYNSGSGKVRKSYDGSAWADTTI